MSSEKSKKNIIGLRLRAALEERGVRPPDVAEKLGVPASTVYGWTQGLREPKGEILGKIVKEFGINPFYLLTGEEPILLPLNTKTSIIKILESLYSKKKLRKTRNSSVTDIAFL